MAGYADSLLGPIAIFLADLIIFALVARLGKRTRGRGTKYQPFSGGEKAVPARGLYQSSLFIFAALFLVVETFALLLAGSIAAPGAYYPILFLLGGGSVMTLTVLSFLEVGGGEF